MKKRKEKEEKRKEEKRNVASNNFLCIVGLCHWCFGGYEREGNASSSPCVAPNLRDKYVGKLQRRGCFPRFSCHAQWLWHPVHSASLDMKDEGDWTVVHEFCWTPCQYFEIKNYDLDKYPLVMYNRVIFEIGRFRTKTVLNYIWWYLLIINLFGIQKFLCCGFRCTVILTETFGLNYVGGTISHGI